MKTKAVKKRSMRTLFPHSLLIFLQEPVSPSPSTHSRSKFPSPSTRVLPPNNKAPSTIPQVPMAIGTQKIIKPLQESRIPKTVANNCTIAFPL